MNWKSTAAVSGVTLVATWLGWTPTRQVTGVQPTDVTPIELPASTDIQEQAARLQSRVRGELAYQDPKRNPFRFIVRRIVDVPASPPALVPVPSDAAPAPFDTIPFALSGMATDPVDGELQRTAILTTASDVLFVKEGDMVGTFMVTGVDETGVEVTAADGTVRRLPLTP